MLVAGEGCGGAAEAAAKIDGVAKCSLPIPPSTHTALRRTSPHWCLRRQLRTLVDQLDEFWKNLMPRVAPCSMCSNFGHQRRRPRTPRSPDLCGQRHRHGSVQRCEESHYRSRRFRSGCCRAGILRSRTSVRKAIAVSRAMSARRLANPSARNSPPLASSFPVAAACNPATISPC